MKIGNFKMTSVPFKNSKEVTFDETNNFVLKATKPEHYPFELPLSKCNQCPLYKANTYRPYNSTGNFINPRILIVGEAPGSAEAITGKVFQGKAGQLMRRTLTEVGLNSDTSCFVMNVVHCRPTDEKGDNRKPERQEIACCYENVEVALSYFKNIVKVIVPMGAVPLKRLTNKASITNARGIEIKNSYGSIIPSFHPAYVLRNMELLPQFKSDLTHIVNFINNVNSNKGGEYFLADTIPKVDWLFSRLHDIKHITVDIETTGLNFWSDQILGLSFSWQRKTGVYLPLNIWPEDQLREIKYKLSNVLLSSDISKTNHNIKFDIKFLEYWLDIKIQSVRCDTMLSHYLLDENQLHRLKEIADIRYSDLRGYSEEIKDIVGQSKLDDGKLNDVPLEKLAIYGAKDADASFRLFEDIFCKELSPNAKRLVTHFYVPLTRIYADSETTGVKVDKDYVIKTSEELTLKLKIAEQEIWNIAGKEFNINSPKQLVEILFTNMKLPILNLTPGGSPSTDEKTLKLMGNYPICAHILEYRGNAKMLSTYLIKMLNIGDENNRIHPTYKLSGTVTNRFSSESPNIQNIPRDPKIKGIFVPEKDFYLLEIDYNQIELRVMAWYSQDSVMMQEYIDNKDIHTINCMYVFGLTEEQIKTTHKRFRKLTKLCNFGGMYGVSAKALMMNVNEKLEKDDPHLTLDSAQKFITFFFEKYKGIGQYIRRVTQIIYKEKKVTNCFGGTRHLPNVESPDADKKAEAVREGVNAVIQGTASNCTQFSIIMIELMFRNINIDWETYFNTDHITIWNWLCRPKIYKTRFLFSVHDALIFELHKDELFLETKIKEIMLKPPPPFDMIVDAEVKIYKERWGNV